MVGQGNSQKSPPIFHGLHLKTGGIESCDCEMDHVHAGKNRFSMLSAKVKRLSSVSKV